MTTTRLTTSLLAVTVAGCLSLAAYAALSMMSTVASAPPSIPAAAAEAPGAAHALPFGPVRPARTLPDVPLTRHDGSATTFNGAVSGRFTLVNLFFAGCSTTCPVQGAIFRETQAQIARRGLDARLISISVDTLGDRPERLAEWLAANEAGPLWSAAVPKIEDVGTLVDALQGRGRGYDVHDARTYLIDPAGRLIYVTEDLPSPEAIVALLEDARSPAQTPSATEPQISPASVSIR